MERNEERYGRVQLETVDKALPVELTSEITLPDYRSEISRLLWVRPLLLPPSHFVGGGRVDFSGPVRYCILYVGPDGALYSAQSEESYAFSVPLEGGVNGLTLTSELTPEAVISRVTGPRRLSVRCRMHARVRGYEERDIAPAVGKEGANSEKLCRLCAVADCGRVLVGESEQIVLTDDLAWERSDLRVILSEGQLMLSEVTATEGAVRCRGEVLIRLLLQEEEGEHGVLTPECRLPLECELPLQGATPDHKARVCGHVGEVQVEAGEGGVTLNATVHLRAEAQGEDSVLLCRDLFLPGYDTKASVSEVPLWRDGGCRNLHFSVTGTLPPELLGSGTAPYCTADAELEGCTVENGHTVLSGKVRCVLLCRREGEWSTAEFLIPFRTVLQETGDRIALEAEVYHCRITEGKDGGGRVDAEVCISLRARESAPATTLGEVEFGPCEPMPRADLEICYPFAGQSLWDVAKRYGISPEALAAANGLSAEDPGNAALLSTTKYLMIP